MRCFIRFWKRIMHTYKDFSMKEGFWLPGGDRISPLFQKLTKKMFGFIGQSPAEGHG